SGSTLTEDLDLSYRAQLGGWRAVYLAELVVPQELPISVNGYRTQQARWAAGSFQCAARLLGPVLRSERSRLVKFEAVVHLLGYTAPVLMLLQIACYPILVVGFANRPPDGLTWPLLVSLLSLSPALGLTIAQWRAGRAWWRSIPGCVAWSVLGAGTSLTVAVAVAGVLLLAVARWLPDPFEDSYSHWLIAANLAASGRLQDPLFQMQDTWLPAYHVLAAAVLRLFGIWELPALKALNAALGMG